MSLISITTLILIILLMSGTVYLVYIGAKAVQDPDAPFQPLEFVVSSMVLLCCAITISYFGIVYVVVDQEPDVPQSSCAKYDRASHKHHSMRWLKTR